MTISIKYSWLVPPHHGVISHSGGHFQDRPASTEMQKRWKDDLLFSRITQIFTCSVNLGPISYLLHLANFNKIDAAENFYWLGSSHLRFWKTRKEWIITIKFHLTIALLGDSLESVNTDFSPFISCLLQVGEAGFTGLYLNMQKKINMQ